MQSGSVQQQVNFGCAPQNDGVKAFLPAAAMTAADQFTRSGQEPRFGHGNPGKHLDILISSFEKQWSRMDLGKKGIAKADFVAQKLAERAQRYKGNAGRK